MEVGYKDVAQFLCSRKNFFKTARNSSVLEPDYYVCDGVDEWFDVSSVSLSSFQNIGYGIKMAEVADLGNRFRTEGQFFYVSISHKGVVAVYSFTDEKILELTDMNTFEKVELEVERRCLVGFYDDKLLAITYDYPLRECRVEDMFKNPDTSILKKVGKVDNVYTFADVTRLQDTRRLYYRTVDYIPCEYNVDTGRNIRLPIGKLVNSFCSTMGLDLGVRAIFQERGNGEFLYTLNQDYSVSCIFPYIKGTFATKIFPSKSNPKNLRFALKQYWDSFVWLDDRDIRNNMPISLEPCIGMVRLYQDKFLAFNSRTQKWVVVRIYIP